MANPSVVVEVIGAQCPAVLRRQLLCLPDCSPEVALSVFKDLRDPGGHFDLRFVDWDPVLADRQWVCECLVDLHEKGEKTTVTQTIPLMLNLFAPNHPFVINLFDSSSAAGLGVVNGLGPDEHFRVLHRRRLIADIMQNMAKIAVSVHVAEAVAA